MGAIALVAPSGAGAAVTQEDRDFAAAVRAYDAATLAVTHDPAILDAVRARQQAATACLDAARSLRAHDESSAFVGAIFYTLHAIVPIESGWSRPLSATPTRCARCGCATRSCVRRARWRS